MEYRFIFKVFAYLKQLQEFTNIILFNYREDKTISLSRWTVGKNSFKNGIHIVQVGLWKEWCGFTLTKVISILIVRVYIGKNELWCVPVIKNNKKLYIRPLKKSTCICSCFLLNCHDLVPVFVLNSEIEKIDWVLWYDVLKIELIR